MSKGSEKMSWKHWPAETRVCATCGRKLRIVDVRREHTSYAPDGSIRRRSLYCAEHVHDEYGA